MDRLRPHGRLLALACGTAAVTLVLQLLLATRLSFVEMRALDAILRVTCPGRTGVAVEAVDVGTEAARYEHLRCPGDSADGGCDIPRAAYTEATRRLDRWGAKVIIYDLMFAHHCRYEDAALAAAFRKAGKVIICAISATRPGEVLLLPPTAPLAAAAWGVCAPVVEQPHGTARSVPLLVQAAGSDHRYLSLSLLGFLRFAGYRPEEAVAAGEDLQVGLTRVPTVPGEQVSVLPLGALLRAAAAGGGQAPSGLPAGAVMLIRWRGPGGTIPRQGLWQLLGMSEAEGRRRYAGKAVIVGRHASTSRTSLAFDSYFTTMGPMDGLEIHANALQTLLSGRFIRPLAWPRLLALMAVLAVAASLATRGLRGWRTAAALLGLAGCTAALAVLLMARSGTWLYVFTCELGIALSWALTQAAESSKLSALVSRFVPLFLRGSEPRPGEIRSLEATLLYSDIRGFTTSAEQVASADMLALLNVFHSAVEELIAGQGGAIVKVPGDAILAAFWRSRRGASHATCALRAALQILDSLPALARAWEDAGLQLQIGIGLNSGPVAMALVGKQHLEPTVIGDAVNVAARLEGLTKEVGYPLVVGEQSHRLLQDPAGGVYLGEFPVKGRQEPVRCYGLRRPHDD